MKNLRHIGLVVVAFVVVVGQRAYGMEEGHGAHNVPNPLNNTNLVVPETVGLPTNMTVDTPKSLVDAKNPWAFVTESPLMQPLLWMFGYAKNNPGKVIVGGAVVGAGVGGYLYLTKDLRKTGKLLNEAEQITEVNENIVDSLQIQALENMSYGDTVKTLAKQVTDGSKQVQNEINLTFNTLNSDARRIIKNEQKDHEKIQKKLKEIDQLVTTLPTQGQLNGLIKGLSQVVSSQHKSKKQLN